MIPGKTIRPAEFSPPAFVYPGPGVILTPVSAEVVFCSDMGYNTVIIYAMEVTGWNRTKQQPGSQFRWYWYC